MNKLLTEAAPLDNRLLSSDEEEYDRVAIHVASLFDRAQDLQNVNLDNLDPSHQAIPFFYVLTAQIDALVSTTKPVIKPIPPSLLPEGFLWPNIARALLQFDPVQIRYAGRQFARVIEVVFKGAEQSGEHIPAIQLLANAILRLDPTSSTLTTTHYYYIRLCMLARAYGDGIAILDLPIYSIPSADAPKQLGNRAYKALCSVHDSSSVYLTPAIGLTGKITSRIYLEYFLMGGMCYMAMGDYQKALFFYEVVLVAPTIQNVASAVTVDAYKKWLLVSLLIKGTDAPIPKAMSPNAIKIVRPLAKPYECIVEAFKSNRLDRLQAEIQEGYEIWSGESNYGLVHEVLMAFRKFSIIKLGKIYAALTMEEVAQRVAPDSSDVQETVTYVQNLIATGQLQAEVVPSTTGSVGTLRFDTNQNIQMSEVEVEAQLAARTRELHLLMKQISDYDHQMAISKDYIEWLQKLKAARDKEKKSGVPGNRSTEMPLDEDMMSDL